VSETLRWVRPIPFDSPAGSRRRLGSVPLDLQEGLKLAHRAFSFHQAPESPGLQRQRACMGERLGRRWRRSASRAALYHPRAAAPAYPSTVLVRWPYRPGAGVEKTAGDVVTPAGAVTHGPIRSCSPAGPTWRGWRRCYRVGEPRPIAAWPTERVGSLPLM